MIILAARKETFFSDKWYWVETAKYCNKLVQHWNKQGGNRLLPFRIGKMKIYQCEHKTIQILPNLIQLLIICVPQNWPKKYESQFGQTLVNSFLGLQNPAKPKIAFPIMTPGSHILSINILANQKYREVKKESQLREGYFYNKIYVNI